MRIPINLISVLLPVMMSIVVVGCTASEGGSTPAPTPAPTAVPTPSPPVTTPSYEITDSNLSNIWWRPTSYCSLKLRNTDEASALFRVEFDLITKTGKRVTRVVWQALEPDERKEVTVRYDEGYVETFTNSVTAQALIPAPVSSPVPATRVKTSNITRNLSGLTYTLTTVHWTGNEVMVEWAIENRTGQKVDRNRLNTIFTLGALAVDQEGNEGEYYIPEPFKRHLYHGDNKSYETKWILYPESSAITITLRDIYTDGIEFVDTYAEFVLTR